MFSNNPIDKDLDGDGSASPDSFVTPPNDGESPISSESGTPTGTSASSTIGGFSAASPGFDPADKESIIKHYKSKKEKGILPKDDQFEESIEDEIEKVITNFEAEAGRKASAEERKAMSERARRIRGGGWLEGLKSTLVGKSGVPMEHFNRLAAQYESTIPMMMQRLAAADKKIDDKDKQIEDLREKLSNKPSTDSSGSNTGQEEIERLKQENLALEGRNAAIAKQLRKEEDKNSDLEDKLEKCQSHGNKLQANIDKLEAADEGSSKGNDDASSPGNNQKLKDEIKSLKEQIKSLSDAEGLQERNKKLQARLEKCLASKSANDEANRRRLEKEIANLKEQIKDLENELKSSRDALTPDQRSTADLLKLVDDLQKQNKVLATSRDKFRNDWAANMTGDEHNRHLAQFWDLVEKTRKEMGELQQLVDALYQTLGFKEKYLDAKDALNRMTKASTTPHNATLQVQLLTAKLEAKEHEVRVFRLREQLANAITRKTEAEIKMELGVYEEEELERRVTARTQMYRLHRRAYLDNIFGANIAFREMARQITDTRTRDRINQIRFRYLEPSSLPMPPAPVVGGP
ncbi:hypothetical protein F5X99DRAFT_154697 [Biscogniauxia marginata]|nr:hypothetical protein F5X99DRAFT_154697 [Biscogniauxia marginata]